MGESGEDLGGGEPHSDREPRQEHTGPGRREPRGRGVDWGPGLAGDTASRRGVGAVRFETVVLLQLIL